MPRRSLAQYGYEQTRPHLFLTEADLDLLQETAEAHDLTLSTWIERIVRAWCIERRAATVHSSAPMIAATLASDRPVVSQS